MSQSGKSGIDRVLQAPVHPGYSRSAKRIKSSRLATSSAASVAARSVC